MIAALLCAAMLPIGEMRTIERVARDYRLDAEETRLLVAIRKIENGRPGLEFGVGGADKHHPAQRYTDGVRSFETQARWAAGTIKRRYTGDLDAFARRYCPPNAAAWARMARVIMAKQTKGEVK